MAVKIEGVATLSILAHVKDKTSRVFKLNGKAACVSQVRTAMRGARLEAGNMLCAIRQHAAARPLNGSALLSLLQQASGASLFDSTVAGSSNKLELQSASLREAVGAAEAAVDHRPQRPVQHHTAPPARRCPTAGRGRQRMRGLRGVAAAVRHDQCCDEAPQPDVQPA